MLCAGVAAVVAVTKPPPLSCTKSGTLVTCKGFLPLSSSTSLGVLLSSSAPYGVTFKAAILQGGSIQVVTPTPSASIWPTPTSKTGDALLVGSDFQSNEHFVFVQVFSHA